MSFVKPKTWFFRSPPALREWLLLHHADRDELWIGFYKKSSGKGGITYREALDEALCFGWIDGRLQSIDEQRYQQRFTPRRRGSHWSAANIKRIGELIDGGRMHAAGLAAFEARLQAPAPYSHENRHAPVALDSAHEKRFRANARAWAFFETQPPWYRRNTRFWVMNAKRSETRERRLIALIEACDAGEKLSQFNLAGTRKPKLAT
jgi:uncharacterized protein YdeI (YjbR/CyaY-like superfamily)